MNILYLHGLNNSLSTEKRIILEKHGTVFSPLINYNSQPNSISELCEIYEEKDINVVIGYCMGGFIGYYIANIIQCPALLFNPALMKQSFLQYIPNMVLKRKNYTHLVLGTHNTVTEPKDTLKFISEALNNHPEFKIHIHKDLAHRIPIHLFNEEVELFFSNFHINQNNASNNNFYYLRELKHQIAKAFSYLNPFWVSRSNHSVNFKKEVMSYTDNIKNHLSNYKEKNFPKLENGIWKNNKKPYSHILPESNKFYNLLEPYQIELKEYVISKKINCHSDFHHLNSSQAMCLNFFFPLFQEHKLELITEYLGFQNEIVNYESVCFEKDGLELKFGSSRPTSFDFYFKTVSAKKFYFEIKYTEGEFGKAKLDTDKFNKYYSKSLKSINTDFQNAESFFNNYQILRNLIHIDDNSFVVFVYPKENKAIKKGAEKVKREFLIPKFHNNFHDIDWRNLFNDIIQKNDNEKLKKQFNEFEKKYLP